MTLESVLDQFRHRIHTEWLPSFCNDEKRRLPVEGFKEESIKVSAFDANNFLRALDSGLVKDSGGGRYRCMRSHVSEQIFWDGQKSIEPRPLTLWLEPVITIGTMARLGLDFGWPDGCLCMQSKDWAFDFAVFESVITENELIAGEVKKSMKELDQLIADLNEFGRIGLTVCPSELPKTKNSFKKWLALLRCRAPLFWAVGPNDYTHLFSVKYEGEHRGNFCEVELDRLRVTGNI